ncbi:MAG: 50S ribosomal protein L9 [Saprospiraceae bacterium]|nr:50S ribosomal protein L9 [Saprospiraceae bacterium]
MEIILLQDVDKVGDRHSIVTVKDGYGRNFLIPKGLAIVANDGNRRRLAEVIKQEDAKESKMLDTYKVMANQLSGQTLKIGAKAGTSGKIFGSVTNVQIAAAIKEQIGLDIPRKKIVLNDEIKELGEYTATIALHKEVNGTVKFEVIAE